MKILSIWDWTAESDRPHCALELKNEYSDQHFLQFNPRQSSQLVSNSSAQVLFYEWSHEYGLIYFDPELTERVNFGVSCFPEDKKRNERFYFRRLIFREKNSDI